MSLRITALALLCAASTLAPPASARAEAPDGEFSQKWKIASRAAWPPVPMGSAVVLKSGNTLVAHAMADGKTTWTAKFKKLTRGGAVLAGAKGVIYVLGRRGVILISSEGKVIRTYKVRGATSMLQADDSIYVATKNKVLRLDAAGQKELGSVKLKGARILGASGRYATVYTRQKQAKGSRLSPNLLQVLDLATGKVIYQFRLLPDGSHSVVKMDAEQLTFVDYTVADRKGNNRKKLYFTTVNYRENKKLRDLSLSKLYASAKSDTIWIALGNDRQIFVATHGGNGHEANVAAYLPDQRKTLWERLGTQPNRGLTPYMGLLWSVIRDDKGNTKLTGLHPLTGKAVARFPLDGSAIDPPAQAAGHLLVRTTKSIYCFGGKVKEMVLVAGNPSPAAAKPAKSPAPTTPAPETVDEPAALPLATPAPAADVEQPPPLPTEARTTPAVAAAKSGYRTHRDSQLGFSVQTPEAWFVDETRRRRMGGPRAVTPFARVKKMPGRRFFLGTVQVLTWEASGRDASGLWRSIYVQRRQLSPDMRVQQVHQIKNVGGTGLPGVVARYSFSGPGGQPVKLRSLCVVSNGVAYELRAWAGPMRPKRTWREIEEIFSSFKVFKP